MKSGIFIIPYSWREEEELKGFDKVYAFQENLTEYWYAPISKEKVQEIKENNLSEKEINKIIKKLNFKREIEKRAYYSNDIVTFFQGNNKKPYKYNFENHEIGEEKQSVSHTKQKSCFVGEYKISNKKEVFKNYFIDFYNKLIEKKKELKFKLERKTNPYDSDLYGIFVINSDYYLRFYAINEEKKVYIASTNEEIKNIENLDKKNLQEIIYKLNFEDFDFEMPMIKNILSSCEEKVDSFRYDLFQEKDLVYEGMGNGGYYAGNFYIDYKKVIKNKIDNF